MECGGRKGQKERVEGRCGPRLSPYEQNDRKRAGHEIIPWAGTSLEFHLIFESHT